MQTILPGQVAVLRTTGENVYVISLSSTQEDPRVVATVRRPLATRDGLKHLIETFFIEELQTREDSLQEQFNEMQERTDIVEKFRAKKNAMPTVVEAKEFLQ